MTLRAENGDGTEKAEGRGEQAVKENEHISEENRGCHPITREAIKLHRRPQTRRLKNKKAKGNLLFPLSHQGDCTPN